jgi:CDP-diacylglycerol--serine O-phosphatidyltransferase
MKAVVPNALTSGNLACGCAGIIACFDGQLTLAAMLIIWAAAFDFLDGFAARFLGVSGEFGKQLDSLADVVSFGVLQGMLLFQLLRPADAHYAYASLLIPVFSALRLAKFNIDPRQTDGFIGVPTPANALLIGSLPFIQVYHADLAGVALNFYTLLAVCFVMPLLLVSELPLIALKFKNFGWKGNEFKYVLLASSAVLLLLFRFAAIPPIIFLYIILSVIQHFTRKQ